jgi:putative ABC transport system substrate-binding protein
MLEDTPMMRPTVGLLLALGLLGASLAAEAQQAMRVYRIGWLSAGPAPPEPTVQIQAFLQGLRDLGYVEGHNLALEYRYAAGSAERLHDSAAELVRLPVDVIVAVSASGTRGAQRATRTIPIVMTGNYDPVAEGFVASLARPGGNITGLSNLRAALIGKQLEFLKELVPQRTRVAVYVDKVLKGANPAELPVEQPTTFELVINLKTAEAMGLTIPPVLLFQATEVIR